MLIPYDQVCDQSGHIQIVQWVLFFGYFQTPVDWLGDPIKVEGSRSYYASALVGDELCQEACSPNPNLFRISTVS